MGADPNPSGGYVVFRTEFTDTLSSIFTSLRVGRHNFFYIFHREYSIIVYRKADEHAEATQGGTNATNATTMPGQHIRAVLTPISRGLREALVKEGVIEMSENEEQDEQSQSPKSKVHRVETMDLDDEGANGDERPVFDIDDEASWDALKAAKVIQMKSKSGHGTKFHDGTDYNDPSALGFVIFNVLYSFR